MTSTQTSLDLHILHGLTPLCRDADLTDNAPNAWRGLGGDVMVADTPGEFLSDLGTLRVSDDTGRIVTLADLTDLADNTLVRQSVGYTYFLVRGGEPFFLDGTSALNRPFTHWCDYLVLGHLEAVAA